jgi:NAD(P)-dependent dehydrogenase (short-subunit alcohol dehydrogenase family)
MSGLKTAIITGGNTGIGFNAAAKLLAKGILPDSASARLGNCSQTLLVLLCATGGYELILACRNVERGNAAAEELRAAHPGSTVTVMQCDVASLQSVEQFADALKVHKGYCVRSLVFICSIVYC